MRQSLTFICEGATLAATLDTGGGTTGLLIVSGGNEIRIGAHRGMTELAATVASEGYPVFRYDRRGVGDSEGSNEGFALSGPDIVAAVAAYRKEVPGLTRIVAFGNCDAATALVVYRGVAEIDALVLANPWVVPPVDDLPPPAAIKERYARRMRDPAAWAALLTGRVDMRALGRGLGRLAMPKRDAPLVELFASGLTGAAIPTHILLSRGDATAIAFADAWRGDVFATARNNPVFTVTDFDSASHSFASAVDFTILREAILAALAA